MLTRHCVDEALLMRYCVYEAIMSMEHYIDIDGVLC